MSEYWELSLRDFLPDEEDDGCYEVYCEACGGAGWECPDFIGAPIRECGACGGDGEG